MQICEEEPQTYEEACEEIGISPDIPESPPVTEHQGLAQRKIDQKAYAIRVGYRKRLRTNKLKRK